MDESPYRTDLGAANAEIDRLQVQVVELQRQETELKSAVDYWTAEAKRVQENVTFLGLLKYAVGEEGSYAAIVICTLAFLTAVSLTTYFTAQLFAPGVVP